MGNKGTPGFDSTVLRGRRQKAGFSQAELARRAEIPRSYVSKYESGRIAPNPDQLAAMARALGAAPLDFVETERLGSGLAALRVAAGLRQVDVASQAGKHMTVSRYQMLELGRIRNLTRADIASLARVFRVSYEAVYKAHLWDLARGAQHG